MSPCRCATVRTHHACAHTYTHMRYICMCMYASKHHTQQTIYYISLCAVCPQTFLHTYILYIHTHRHVRIRMYIYIDMWRSPHIHGINEACCIQRRRQVFPLVHRCRNKKSIMFRGKHSTTFYSVLKNSICLRLDTRFRYVCMYVCLCIQ
jgi:hypothetical protein